MTDKRPPVRLMDEAVPAMAGVLDAAVALTHSMHVMSEETTRVADTLLEPVPLAVRVCVEREQQRMAASDARVFHVAVTGADRLIRVVAEEARHRVADSRRGRIVSK